MTGPGLRVSFGLYRTSIPTRMKTARGLGPASAEMSVQEFGPPPESIAFRGRRPRLRRIPVKGGDLVGFARRVDGMIGGGAAMDRTTGGSDVDRIWSEASLRLRAERQRGSVRLAK